MTKGKKFDVLSEGKVVRNYKEMCKLLDEEVKTSNSRKAQIKDWQRYFDFEKDGHKFIITKVYDEPLQQEFRKSNNAIYVDYIELLLMYYLSDKDGYTHEFTTNELYLKLAFVNEKYINFRRFENTKNVIEQLNKSVTVFDVYKFNARVVMKFNTILNSALKSMRNRRLIEFFEVMYVVDVSSGEEKHILATEDQLKDVLNVEKDVMNEMGFRRINNVYFAFQGREFRRRVNDILLERYNWKYAYKKCRIVFLKKEIIKTIPLAKVEIQKRALNQRIISAIDTEAQTQYNNNIKKINKEFKKFMDNSDVWGDGDLFEIFKETEKPFVYDDGYVESQKKLSQYFMNHSMDIDIL